MHIATKVLIIVVLLLSLILSQYVAVALAGSVQWRERYEWEVAARHRDKDRLEAAYREYLAARHKNREDKAEQSAELAKLNASRATMESWQADSALARRDVEARAQELEDAVRDFPSITRDYDNEVVSVLQAAVAERTGKKRELFTERGTLLKQVATAHSLYARHQEDYLRMEFQQFVLQEELERRLDMRARYRSLRPDLQADLGENGPVIFARVVWSTATSLQLNKGRRDGVELFQKYTVTRNGVTVAVVNVVEVQNETCECTIEDVPNRQVLPREGDEAVTRLFMARLTGRRP
ncbi:hypothetical protein EDM80_10000 [bacterium]|nr:MAG: hypothetical protein EDM80_10000 [bacterium]RIK64410.1 MAG: hypothetical protein DCC64_04545 [Planctomycetota bacterium]